MSWQGPGPADLTVLLQGLAGTYLRNPLRTNGGCARCAGVANPGFAECFQCGRVYGDRLPNLAGFMTYAADGTQAGHLIRCNDQRTLKVVDRDGREVDEATLGYKIPEFNMRRYVVQKRKGDDRLSWTSRPDLSDFGGVVPCQGCSGGCLGH